MIISTSGAYFDDGSSDPIWSAAQIFPGNNVTGPILTPKEFDGFVRMLNLYETDMNVFLNLGSADSPVVTGRLSV